jgi:hypothetical protein
MPTPGHVTSYSHLPLKCGPISEPAWSLQAYYAGHTPLSLTAGDAITRHCQQSTEETSSGLCFLPLGSEAQALSNGEIKKLLI